MKISEFFEVLSPFFVVHFYYNLCRMKYLFLLAVIVFSGCISTQRVSYVSGVSETDVTLPEGTKNVTLLNRVRLAYPYDLSSTILDPNNPTVLNKASNEIKRQLRTQSTLSIYNESSSFRHNADGDFPAELTILEAQQVGAGSDLIVSIEKFGQHIADKYTIEIRRQNLGNNVYRDMDLYIGKREIRLSLGCKLYHTKTGAVIDTWQRQETYFYEAEALTRQRVTQLLNINYSRELQNLGFKYGHQFALRIAPTEYKNTVEIYDKGNENLEKAMTAVQLKNWAAAQELWEQGLQYEKNRRKRAMLLHNLAINEKRLGHTDKARSIALRAAEQHPLGVKTQSFVGFLPAAF